MSGGAVFKKPMRLEDDKVSYIRQMEAPLREVETGEMGEEEVELLTKSFFAELKNREASVSCNKKCSFVLEQFLGLAPPSLLSTFIQRSLPYLHFMMHSPYASHILQTLLRVAEKKLDGEVETGRAGTGETESKGKEEDEGDEAESGIDALREAIQSMAEVMLDEGLVDYICNSTATHVIRSLFQFLAGIEVKKKEAQKKSTDKGVKLSAPSQLNSKVKETPVISTKRLSEELKSLWDGVVERFVSAPDEALADVVRDPHGGAALSSLIETLSASKHKKLNSVLRNILGLKKGKDDAGGLGDLPFHPIASHVVEVAMRCCSDAFYAEALTR